MTTTATAPPRPTHRRQLAHDAGRRRPRQARIGPRRTHEGRGGGPGRAGTGRTSSRRPSACRRVEILAAQFKNVLIVILLVATILSAVLGHGTEAIAIAAIVLLAVLLGFVQEYRAERATDALRRMAAPTATVLRDGEEFEVPARQLVPGDVILLRAGDRVPADVRLLESVNLQVEEAALTGESVPVEKHADALDDPGLVARRPPEHGVRRDRRDLRAREGRGHRDRDGHGIRRDRRACSRPWRPAARLCRRTSIASAARWRRPRSSWSAIIVGLGLLRGQPFIEMFIFGIALAVAAVPEALPAVVTISLAIGVQRMVKRHALMRRLPAVETLGCTEVICSDKTGTLTKDEMTVRAVFVAGELLEVTGAGYEPSGIVPPERHARSIRPTRCRRLLTAATLASDARIVHDASDGRWRVKGDPTEGALVVAAGKGRPAQVRPRHALASRRRDSVHVRNQADDDAPCRSRGRSRVCEGRTGGHPRILHAPVDDVGRGAARRGRTRRGGGRRPRPGRARAARPRRGLEAGRPARLRGARHDLARAGRHDRSSAAGGAGGHPHLRAGRHPRDHDHRRPSR